jgi:hypothetical protein
MRKLLVAGAVVGLIALARPASAYAGLFFSFSQPGFGITVGAPCPRPAYWAPPVVYVPPPVVYGRHQVRRPPHWRHRPHAWRHARRAHGHRWR